ncbi:glucose-6-phosphate exchanger SLC37A2 isoform X4 [Neomonachus schauinslandi]|uniref:Glucose-6-phosphate exchanger SLC37A2 n=1 Tax=Neomonachus schauinslandi TaxID=29088 RepID=A0A2Y9HJW4_NEOSC|nr:glucose-6-phosphate exchanger SLC37A2 isoform X4 [Neomonachus schauinslandi]
MRSSLAPGVCFLRTFSRDSWFRGFILLLTFFIYTCYHMSRKPISVVKSRLHQNCSELVKPINDSYSLNDTTWCDWAPFDKNNYKELLGAVDNAFLVAYAIGMFISGTFGERLPLRYYLSAGMLLSGLFTSLFGLGYFWNIHMLWYFVLIQICNGLVQTTGWPSVVTCVGNWFGKGKRGLIMGIWNSHTSVGNILGSLIAGMWVNEQWGLSFVVPGVLTAAMGVLTFLFLIEYPEDVDCTTPQHHTSDGLDENQDNPADLGNGPCINKESSLESAARCSKEPRAQPAAISFLGALRIPLTLVPNRPGTCLPSSMLVASWMFLYNYIGQNGITNSIVMLIVCGALVNGPYALITTAVSADLGTHKSLKGNSKALSTVTAIIDGTGSIGAALGPLLAGLISPTGWNNVFYMLISADILACLLLCRLVYKELLAWKSSLSRDRGSSLALTHPR